MHFALCPNLSVLSVSPLLLHSKKTTFVQKVTKEKGKDTRGLWYWCAVCTFSRTAILFLFYFREYLQHEVTQSDSHSSIAYNDLHELSG